MAAVSGRLIFDRERTGQAYDWLTGIAGVTIVLRNTATDERITAVTDANGNYSFQNVADGSYQIIEFYEKDGGFPPISYAQNPPPSATNLDAVSPNTINITVSGADVTNQNILNGPVTYSPIETIMDSSVIVSPENLITRAANGTFGTYPPGTPANTGADPNPYPDIGTQFVYALPNPEGVVPVDGGYTIQNIMSNSVPNQQNNWWRVADHTQGNETGRMMVINGNYPGAVIFQQPVNVEPNTYYLLSSWIMNLSKEISHAEPALGVQVLDANGNILYDATLGALIPMKPEAPEWKQIGTVINSQDNSTITVQFISKGPAAWGNDYVIDDVMLNKVQVPEYKPVKSVDKTAVNIGDIVTYTVTLENNGKNPHTNVNFHDALPDGVSFVDGSVTINGVPDASANPNAGFPVPDVEGGGKLTVTFQGRVDRVPNPNPAVNFADIHYAYSPVIGGIPWNVSGRTNDADVRLITADLAVTKSGTAPAISGGVLLYLINVTNTGPDTAQSTVVSDRPPPELSNVMYSLDHGLTWMEWTEQITLAPLAPSESAAIQIKGEVSSMATGNILNTATVSSPTFDPNTDNNTSNTVTPVEMSADISVVKIAGATSVISGETIRYSLTASNAGPSPASSVVISDTLPAGLLNPQYSVDNGTTWNAWTGSYNAGTLAAGQSVTLQIRANIDPALPVGNIENTATVTSPTRDPNTANNTSTVTTAVRQSADLAVSKTADKNPLPAGEAITYTITAVNNGPSAAQSVQILDTVPAELSSVVFSTDGGATWNPWNGSFETVALAVGQSVTILIRGMSSTAASGSVTNAATVRSSTPDPDLLNNTSEITTPIDRIPEPPRPYADLEITKTADKQTVNAGDTLTFTLAVRNLGADDALNTVVTDNIPGGLLSPQFSTDNGATWNDWTGSYTAASVANGAVLNILIRGTVDPGSNPEVTPALINSATVKSDIPDPNPNNNTSSASSELTTSADISVVKTAEPTPAVSGQIITYNITVRNGGPSAARDVVLIDPVVEDISNQQISTDGGITWQPWASPFFLGNMARNEVRNIQIRGTLQAAVTEQITNTATVGASTPDPDTRNNVSTIETPVRPTADISVVKTASSPPIVVGEKITYTLVVSNAGPSYAQEVTVRDNLPPELGDTEYSVDGGLTWRPWTGSVNIGTMAPGTSSTVLLRGTVNDFAADSVINTANVMNTVPDPNLNNNTSTIETPVVMPVQADLRITKTVHPNVARPCSAVIYKITVLNAGPQTAVNTTLVDILPHFITYPHFSVNGGNTWRTWNGTLYLGNMDANASREILIRGTISRCAYGKLKNSARVFSDTPETNLQDNTSSAAIIIR